MEPLSARKLNLINSSMSRAAARRRPGRKRKVIGSSHTATYWCREAVAAGAVCASCEIAKGKPRVQALGAAIGGELPICLETQVSLKRPDWKQGSNLWARSSDLRFVLAQYQRSAAIGAQLFVQVADDADVQCSSPGANRCHFGDR